MSDLGPVYTMEEAAKRLRISRRTLQEIVKIHPFYFSTGQRKLFTEDDLLALVAAMRPQPAARLADRGSAKDQSSGELWERARQLLSRPRR